MQSKIYNDRTVKEPPQFGESSSGSIHFSDEEVERRLEQLKAADCPFFACSDAIKSLAYTLRNKLFHLEELESLIHEKAEPELALVTVHETKRAMQSVAFDLSVLGAAIESLSNSGDDAPSIA